MTDVTIRGIDDDTYSKFAAEAKRRSVSIGELTTMAMASVINKVLLPLDPRGFSYHNITTPDRIEKQMPFMLFALLFLGEVPTGSIALGGGLIVLSVVLISLADRSA